MLVSHWETVKEPGLQNSVGPSLRRHKKHWSIKGAVWTHSGLQAQQGHSRISVELRILQGRARQSRAAEWHIDSTPCRAEASRVAPSVHFNPEAQRSLLHSRCIHLNRAESDQISASAPWRKTGGQTPLYPEASCPLSGVVGAGFASSL